MQFALDKWGKLAAATSTGGLVGKWKGRVGDTAIVGAGIYADEKLPDMLWWWWCFLTPISCSQSSQLIQPQRFRSQTGCQEVIIMIWRERVQELLLWTIKVRPLLKPMLGSCLLVQWSTAFLELKFWDPMMGFSNVIWETDELVAHLQPTPLTPVAHILTRKTINGPRSIFQLVLSDYVAIDAGGTDCCQSTLWENLVCIAVPLCPCQNLTSPLTSKSCLSMA